MRPTGSSLERAHKCPASHALARAEETSDAAARGSEIHAYLARVIVSPAERGLALRDVPDEHRGVCAAIDIASVLDGFVDTMSEVAYAFDVVKGTSRCLGRNLGRKYVLTENEIACSLDLDGTRNGVKTVRDFKTGQDVGDVASSWQLRFQALCVARHADEGADTVDAGFTYIDEAGQDRTVSHTFDGLDFDLATEELRDIWQRVQEAEAVVAAGKTPTTHLGDHCRYCPALPYCPSQTALVRAMLPELERIDGLIAALSPTQMGEAWTKLRQIKTLTARLEDAIKVSAGHNGGVPLPNGKHLRMVPSSRSSFDRPAAEALLAQRGASAEEIRGLVRVSHFEVCKETIK